MSEGGDPRGTWRRLRGYAKPYRGLLVAAFLAMALEAGASAAIVELLKHIVDDIFVARQFVWWLPAGMVLLLLARGFFGLVGDYTIARSGRNVARDLRLQLMDKYLRLPGSRFDRETVPSMLTRLGADTEQVAEAAVDALKVMVSNALQIIALLAVMFWNSWKVSLVLLVLAPAMAWMMGKVGRRYRRLNHEIQQSAADMLQTADQALHAQQEVKAYGAQDSEMARYGNQTARNVRLALKVEVTRGSLSMFVQGLGAIGMAAMLFVAGREAAQGQLSAGGFMAVMTAMISLVPALRQLTNVQSMLNRGINSADRVFDILDAADEPDHGTRPLERARGLIEFRDVGARYEGADVPALHGLSFTARPGTVTAIVGRSGSGKSTLIKLIPRFYQPESGEILLDGHPLAEYRLADLRRQIAIVSQQVMLFDGSIGENIAYGEMRDADAKRVKAAIHGANAMEFVERLPEGIDSVVGERGGKLSGGQRQRLAIARAMLKDAPILILDEATAALDNESERLVQDALNQLMPDRTTLVIAHRLSTIEHADQVLVLDQGRLVERGTHAELIAHDGLYARLHRMQFREAV
ncbi:lipid A export permease/ATP-binding protein MsbA [Lysobacter pythonis]|uniref:Lipid A export permease/ATP-binding protein MsbA n=1 Tax=Solilutibacter pythonis TaxID=2483112 RepID=A0A3M2I5S5_9GAMM|nr:lipid A export permease/ATP-binding protein MsbA [Lysobacter pythonis]RMH94889.1 lipid A export permease/ATP-binding protein MsbA [Lysobacter pythonis]